MQCAKKVWDVCPRLFLVLLALLFIIFVYTMLLIGLVGLFIAAWNIKKK